MGLHLLDDTLTKAQIYNGKSKREKRLLRYHYKLRSRALREPRTIQQKLDRVNLDRVSTILRKRYGWF
jgi:hypothetical protein|tara:strand:- start:25 stop:228 length:204 start_codon:yes stop_codon:yes gene_type:complete